MNTPPPPPQAGSCYEKDYEEAEVLFDDGEIDKSVKWAKDNLADKSLPPLYNIKNCVLIASALEDWDEGNLWRLAAEQTYVNTLDEAKRNKDKQLQADLADLRKELDELAEYRLEDLTGLSKDELKTIVGDDNGIGIRILEDALEQLEIENSNKGK